MIHDVRQYFQPGDPVVLDLETDDPHLLTLGTDAHCQRWGGYVFMAAFYFPLADKDLILRWEEAVPFIQYLMDEGADWVGANFKYDLNWCLRYNAMHKRHVNRRQRFRDILVYAPLLDETQYPGFYSLDNQSIHYGLPTKPITMLLASAVQCGLVATEKTIKGMLHKLPWDVVAEYARHDVRTTWAVYQKQWPLIVEAGLERVAELEDRLLPVLALMEMEGIAVDVDRAEVVYKDIYAHIDAIKEELRQANEGKEVSVTASNNLTAFIQSRGHLLPHTPAHTEEKPRYSTASAVMNTLAAKDPLIGKIVIARKAEKIAKDFCKGTILDLNHNGRIYPNINQIVGRKLDGDDDESKGVRYGRLSYCNGSPQVVPKRNTIGFDDTGGLGTAMRSLFPSEDRTNDMGFMSADFSSQEPRWIIHWTETWKIPGASRIGDMYRLDPTISSHDIVAEGLDAPGLSYKERRDLAKIINLGKGYEMGLRKLIANLVAAGLDPSQAQNVIDLYEENFPHVSLGSKAAMGAAERLGYVRTYSGRRLLFNLYEPCNKQGPALPYEDAFQKYVMALTGRTSIRRAFCYRAFNRIVQGSSADQTKLAMISLWYEHGLLASMQVHDELTDSRSTPERAAIFKHVMENVCQLTIPSLTEVKIGPNWGSGKLWVA